MPKVIDLADLDNLELSEETIPESKNYVDNKKLYQVLSEYHEKKKVNIEQGKDKPPLPNYVSRSIIDISNNLSYSPKFINYTYKDEMIGDAIEICVRYIDNFNPEKSKNPFAYITTIAYQAFVRRIKKEHRQYYYKLKTIHLYNGFVAENEGEGVDSDQVEQSELFNDTASQVSEYERKHREKYIKSKEDNENKKPDKNNLEEYL